MRLSAFLFAAALFGQQVDTIQNAGARAGASLNGAWQYLLDPYEAGYYDFHMKPIADGGLGSNRVPANKGDKYEIAFTAQTPTMQVPATGTHSVRSCCGTKGRSGSATRLTTRPMWVTGNSYGSAQPITTPSFT